MVCIPVMALLALISAPLTAGLGYKVMGKIREYSKGMLKAGSEKTAFAEDAIWFSSSHLALVICLNTSPWRFRCTLVLILYFPLPIPAEISILPKARPTVAAAQE